MNFKFFCPHCGQHISAENDMQGKSVDCPACAGKFIVPFSITASLTPEPELPPTNSPEIPRKAPARFIFRALWAPRSALPPPASSRSPSEPPRLPQTKANARGALTKQQQTVLAVALALFALVVSVSFSAEIERVRGQSSTFVITIANTAIGTVNRFLSPVGVFLIAVCGWLFSRYRQPRDRGTEDDGRALLRQAIRLESQYKIQEALAAYADIAQRYAHTAAGHDAQICHDSLLKKLQ